MAEDSTQEWLVESQGRRIGPISILDIRKLFRDGKLQPTDRVSHISARNQQTALHQFLKQLGMNERTNTGFQPPPRPLDVDRPSGERPSSSETTATISLFDTLQAAKDRKPRQDQPPEPLVVTTPSNGSSPLLWIGLGALVLGGGAVAYLFLNQPAPNSTPAGRPAIQETVQGTKPAASGQLSPSNGGTTPPPPVKSAPAGIAVQAPPPHAPPPPAPAHNLPPLRLGSPMGGGSSSERAAAEARERERERERERDHDRDRDRDRDRDEEKPADPRDSHAAAPPEAQATPLAEEQPQQPAANGASTEQGESLSPPPAPPHGSSATTE